MDKKLSTIVVTDYNQETKFTWYNVPTKSTFVKEDGSLVFLTYEGDTVFYKVAFGELVLVIAQKGYEEVSREEEPEGVLH